MLSISRCLARQLRAVFRRCVRKPYGALRPWVMFHAGADGLHVRLPGDEVDVTYHHQAGVHGLETVSIPLDALADFEGRGQDVVSLDANGAGQVVARWQDGAVPQAVAYETGDLTKVPDAPGLPERFAANPPSLLNALDAAVQTAASDGGRLAMQRIQLRGGRGQVVATDGRQLLVQGGFQFPWSEDVLIPRLLAFGCNELRQEGSIEVGRTDKHVTLRVGAGTIHLRIDAESRYPDVQHVIPRVKDDSTRWQIDPADAAFLVRSLPRLPGRNEDNGPVTIDLNGEVCVRASSEQGRTVEAVLARSTHTGKPVRFCLNRQLLARLLQLHFPEVALVNPDTPFVSVDGTRTFVGVLLDKKAALPPVDDALRITSSDSEPMQSSPSTERKKTTMTTLVNNGVTPSPGAARPISNDGEHEPHAGNGMAALITEAEALKEVLRDACGRSHRLLVALKHHRKQSQLLKSTLASLRQLQNIGP